MRLALVSVLALLALSCGKNEGGGAPDHAVADDGGVSCGQAMGGFVPTGCEASGAESHGPCRCIIGWHWDGARCAGLGGCVCLRSCDRVYPSEEACNAAYAHC